jgi:hypothetical protein
MTHHLGTSNPTCLPAGAPSLTNDQLVAGTLTRSTTPERVRTDERPRRAPARPSRDGRGHRAPADRDVDVLRDDGRVLDGRGDAVLSRPAPRRHAAPRGGGPAQILRLGAPGTALVTSCGAASHLRHTHGRRSLRRAHVDGGELTFRDHDEKRILGQDLHGVPPPRRVDVEV